MTEVMLSNPKRFRQFMNRIVPDVVTTCWLWKGGDNGQYPRFNKVYAHRMSYEFFKGVIPDGFVIDHLCNVPMCVNPTHLKAVTPSENVVRAVGTTHCPRGHEYSGDNLVMWGGQKRCRECARYRKRSGTRKQKIHNKTSVVRVLQRSRDCNKNLGAP